jgi:hypothetical protein
MNGGDKIIKKEGITKPGGLENIEKIHLTPP